MLVIYIRGGNVTLEKEKYHFFFSKIRGCSLVQLVGDSLEELRLHDIVAGVLDAWTMLEESEDCRLRYREEELNTNAFDIRGVNQAQVKEKYHAIIRKLEAAPSFSSSTTALKNFDGMTQYPDVLDAYTILMKERITDYDIERRRRTNAKSSTGKSKGPRAFESQRLPVAQLVDSFEELR